MQTFDDIKQIAQFFVVSEYDEIFRNIENQAFKFRGDPLGFYSWLEGFFKYNQFSEQQKIVLLKQLIQFKGNWKHEFLSGWLESFNKNDILQNQSIKENTSKDLKQRIEQHFSFMLSDDPRKHKKILNEADFNQLITWLLFFFENNFTLPKIDQPIQKVNTNKGNIIYAFMDIFKQEHPTKTRPDNLYSLIINCFYELRDDKIENLKKQKEPQYYKDLITKSK